VSGPHCVCSGLICCDAPTFFWKADNMPVPPPAAHGHPATFFLAEPDVQMELSAGVTTPFAVLIRDPAPAFPQSTIVPVETYLQHWRSAFA